MTPEERERLVHVLDGAVLGIAGFVLVIRVFSGGVAAELSEPSRNALADAASLLALALAALRRLVAREGLPIPWTLPAGALAFVGTAWASLAIAAEDPFLGLVRSLAWTGEIALVVAVLPALLAQRSRALALAAAVVATAAVAALLAVKEYYVDLPAWRLDFERDPRIADVPDELLSEFESRLYADQASGPFLLPNLLGAYLALAAVPAFFAALGLLRRREDEPAAATIPAAPETDLETVLGTAPPTALGTSLRTPLRTAAFAGLVLAAAAIVLGIELAAQKGPWVALGFGLAVALPRRRAWLAVAAVPVGAGVVLFAAMSVEDLESLPFGGTSLAVRKEYAIAADRVWNSAPATGVGPGNFAERHASVKLPRGEETRFVHNDYQQVLAEQGPVGLFGLALVWGGLLGRVARKPRPRDARADARVRERWGPPARVGRTIAPGGVLGFAVLPVLGSDKLSSPLLCFVAAGVFAAVWLGARLGLASRPDAAPRALLGGAAAFLLAAWFDFVHYEHGVLAGAFLVAAAAFAIARREAPVPRRSGRVRAAILAAVAIAAFGAAASYVVPRLAAADRHRAEASELRRGGRPEEAYRSLWAAVDALEPLPSDRGLLALRGDIAFDLYEARGDAAWLAAAREAYESAVARRPHGGADIHARLAALHAKAGDQGAAHRSWEAAVKAYPSNARYRLEAGRAALLAGDRAGARAHLERALALAKERPRVPRNRLTRQEIREARQLLAGLPR